MAEHRVLTGSSLHEPKGADTASSGEVYTSDGAGSGAWEAPLGLDTANAGDTFIADGAGGGSWIVPPASNHAAAKVTSNTAEITPSVAGTFYEWTPTFTSIDADGVTITGNSFVITVAGSYFITSSLAAQGRGTGTNTYAYDWAVNGTRAGQKARRTTSSTSDVGGVSVQAYLSDLSVGDVVKLYVANETDTDNILITDMAAFIFQLNL